jgi:hypothetical protein
MGVWKYGCLFPPLAESNESPDDTRFGTARRSALAAGSQQPVAECLLRNGVWPRLRSPHVRPDEQLAAPIQREWAPRFGRQEEAHASKMRILTRIALFDFSMTYESAHSYAG